MAVDRRQITFGLLGGLVMAGSAAAQTSAKPRCSASTVVKGLRVLSYPEYSTVEWKEAANGWLGKNYEVEITVREHYAAPGNAITENTVHLGVTLRPGRRTSIEQVLAFWDKPKVDGRMAPVQVKLENSGAALIAGEEGTSWSVSPGLHPTFRGRLQGAEDLIHKKGPISLLVEPVGMAHLTVLVPSADVSAALAKGRELRRELIANGADPKGCKEDTVYEDGCFLTTACCAGLGRPDDCFELQVLRAFRRRHLETTYAGRKLLEDYAAISPRLLDAMRGAGGRLAFYATYLLCILPCVAMIRLGLVHAPTSLYRTTVGILTRNFLKG